MTSLFSANDSARGNLLRSLKDRLNSSYTILKKTSFLLTSFLLAPFSQAALIVNLDPIDARFNSLTAIYDPAAGFNAGNPDATQNAYGLTFNVTFTPFAGDVDSTTQAINLLEVGGDANGSGLYLLGGELHFISKMNGIGADFVSSFVVSDLDFASGNNMIGVKSSFGALTAGTEYSVAVIFDPIDPAPSLVIGVLPTGGTLATESYSIGNSTNKTNWDGDNSASSFQGIDVGNFGGAIISTDGNTTNPFHENNINGNSFEGTQGQALYWTQESPAIIPEPSASLLGLLGSIALLARRRR